MKNLKRSRRHCLGFTLIELLTVISVIALLMAILLPALSKAKKQAKLGVCLSNCKQLVLGWSAYAETYDGKLVNGGQAPPPSPATVNPAAYTKTERYWCTGFPTTAIPNYDWAWCQKYALNGPTLTYEQRTEKMKEGALWPYLKDTAIYRCPEAQKGMHRTYSVANTMNAKWDWIKLGYERDFGKQLETFMNLSQIKKAQERVVFLEEGKPSPDSFVILFSKEKWVDKPIAPHVRGQNFGFADGHAEFWRWEDLRTLAWAKMAWTEDNLNLDSVPAEQKGNRDLQRLQIAAWGELGYTPSPAPRK